MEQLTFGQVKLGGEVRQIVRSFDDLRGKAAIVLVECLHQREPHLGVQLTVIMLDGAHWQLEVSDRTSVPILLWLIKQQGISIFDSTKDGKPQLYVSNSVTHRSMEEIVFGQGRIPSAAALDVHARAFARFADVPSGARSGSNTEDDDDGPE